MPWLAVPFQQSGIRTELAQFYGIRGIPTLLLLDRNGHLITMDARTELVEDPQAQNFPWKPRLVNTVTERLFMSKMHEYLTIILLVDPEEADIQFAESVLLPVAESYYKQRNIDFPNTEEECLQFYIGTDSDTDDLIRDLVNVDEVVPLLVGLDIPNRRYFLMDPHCELTTASVEEFIAKFESNDCKFIDFDVERFPID
ncbi:PREDICTED: nucleoredoxin-like [Nicrophorus vespilloides]|uniref:Nucleoredoxin-like n=1 Tax=Nicrophorus vespilloides TaxID=110193 RepID=A0ABM1N136_NICVS|nr:PREDICTED: nucleoredoxin-like [Nicrophorus vespilloides]